MSWFLIVIPRAWGFVNGFWQNRIASKRSTVTNFGTETNHFTVRPPFFFKINVVGTWTYFRFLFYRNLLDIWNSVRLFYNWFEPLNSLSFIIAWSRKHICNILCLMPPSNWTKILKLYRLFFDIKGRFKVLIDVITWPQIFN